MYEGIKSILKLMNHLCDSRQGCCEECIVYNECKSKDWQLLRNDLSKLDIKEKDIDLPKN